HDREKEAGAVFAEYEGFEDPVYYARNEDEKTPRYTYERGNWFDAVGEEARAVRDSVGLFDFSTFAKYRVEGSGAEKWLDGLFANRVPTENGKMALMPMLSPAGRVIGDFTLTRFADERFILLGAGAMQRIHMRWFNDHLPASGVTIENITEQRAGLHIAGPHARSVLAKLTDADVSNKAQPFLTARELNLAGVHDAIAARVSFTGELGYELYVPWDDQSIVFDALRDAGEEYGLRLAGSHALMSLRLEKSFPSWGLELASDYFPDESGLERFIAVDKGDFVGRDAYRKHLDDEGAREVITTFIIDVDKADAYSGEPVYCNGGLAGYVTSGGYGYRVDKSLALGYLAAEFADYDGAFEVEILGEMRPATRTEQPVYDPSAARMRT
ncbi:MAG: aminomethyltransferase family protein, partial [Pseudomonadota bacterium]